MMINTFASKYSIVASGIPFFAIKSRGISTKEYLISEIGKNTIYLIIPVKKQFFAYVKLRRADSISNKSFAIPLYLILLEFKVSLSIVKSGGNFIDRTSINNVLVNSHYYFGGRVLTTY